VGGDYVSTWPAGFEVRAHVLAPGSARFGLVLVDGAGITYAIGAAFVVVLKYIPARS
jgi:hypothetical protein